MYTLILNGLYDFKARSERVEGHLAVNREVTIKKRVCWGTNRHLMVFRLDSNGWLRLGEFEHLTDLPPSNASDTCDCVSQTLVAMSKTQTVTDLDASGYHHGEICTGVRDRAAKRKLETQSPQVLNSLISSRLDGIQRRERLIDTRKCDRFREQS